MTRRDGWSAMASTARLVLWLTWAWLLLDLVLLFTAFVLQLLGADPDVQFARWVYGSVERAMAPFRGIFTPVELTDRSVLDTSLLFAMVIYGLAAILVQHVMDWVVSWAAGRRHDRTAHASSRSPQGAFEATSAVDPRSPAQRFPDLVVPARPERSPGA